MADEPDKKDSEDEDGGSKEGSGSSDDSEAKQGDSGAEDESSDGGSDDTDDSDTGDDDNASNESDAGSDGGDDPKDDAGDDAESKGGSNSDDDGGSGGGDGPDRKNGGGNDGDGGVKAAAWGRPLVRLDESWTKFEMWLCAVVLVLEIVALSAWVVLKGMSAPPDSGSNAGIVFRALFGALVIGLGLYFGLKKQGVTAQRIGAIAGIAIGFYTAKYWQDVGVDYTSNLLNWYQQASSLTLLGGLRGVGTRLTLMLALLGGSLATAAGKHITIDLVTRFISPRARVPVILIGWVGAAVVCFTASWGFFDHIAIENFGARSDAKPAEKIEKVGEELSEHWFIARKQLSLDLKSTPHIVFKNEPYAEWFTGKEWNAWLDDSGMVERYGKEEIDGLKVDDDELRSPILVVPGKGEPRGELIHVANLVFPFGLLVIALRFLLRSLLVVSGHVGVEGESDDQFGDGEEQAADDGPDGDGPGNGGGGKSKRDDGGGEAAAAKDDGDGKDADPEKADEKQDDAKDKKSASADDEGSDDDAKDDGDSDDSDDDAKDEKTASGDAKDDSDDDAKDEKTASDDDAKDEPDEEKASSGDEDSDDGDEKPADKVAAPSAPKIDEKPRVKTLAAAPRSIKEAKAVEDVRKARDEIEKKLESSKGSEKKDEKKS